MITIAMLNQSFNNVYPIPWSSSFLFSKIIHCHLNENAQIEPISIAKAFDIAIETNSFDYMKNFTWVICYGLYDMDHMI